MARGFGRSHLLEALEGPGNYRLPATLPDVLIEDLEIDDPGDMALGRALGLARSHDARQNARLVVNEN